MDFGAAELIGQRASGSHGFERHLAQLRSAGLGEHQNVGHQRTFASVWSRRTSSGTASAPLPMIRPGGRSEGSSMLFTVTRTGPSCAGFVSSGFFFAAMIPFRDGYRGRAIPSSIVTTAGSGNSTISPAPSISRRAVPLPFAISSLDAAVTTGIPNSSPVAVPTMDADVSNAYLPK